jgi:hypothetical protein
MTDEHRCPRCQSLLFWDSQDRIPACLICGWRCYHRISIISHNGSTSYSDKIHSFTRLYLTKYEDDEIAIISQLRPSPNRNRVLATIQS